MTDASSRRRFVAGCAGAGAGGALLVVGARVTWFLVSCPRRTVSLPGSGVGPVVVPGGSRRVTGGDLGGAFVAAGIAVALLAALSLLSSGRARRLMLGGALLLSAYAGVQAIVRSGVNAREVAGVVCAEAAAPRAQRGAGAPLTRAGAALALAGALAALSAPRAARLGMPEGPPDP